MARTTKTRVRFRERAELLDFLLEVSSLAAESLDLDQLMESIAGIVRQVIPHDLFAILLWSDRLKVLRIRYAQGHRPEVIENLHIHLGEGLTGAAAQSRQPVLVGSVGDDKRYLSALDAVRSELAVPMLVRNKLVGVIDLQSTVEDAFTAQDRALLQLIASRIGSAIDNARLYRRVERQNKTQRTLTRMAQEFSSILNVDALLNKIAKSIRKLISYDAFMVMLVDEKEEVLKSLFSLRFDQRTQHDSLPIQQGITGYVARNREPVLARDTQEDPRYVGTHPGIRSEVAVPLVVKGRVVGVLDLESERVGSFTEDHVRTLSLIAPSIAIAIENARLYEELAAREHEIQEDLESAASLQAIIMPPEAPPLPGLEIGLNLKPARLVSGDVYDFFDYDTEHAMIAFGDSSGKGAAAALYGSLVSGLLRAAAPHRRSPAQLLRLLNETLMERQIPARYITLLVMLWKAKDRSFLIANAGQTTPLVCRGGSILQPQASGVPVGLLQQIEYEESEFRAEPGDMIVLVSDGVHDQTNPAGEEYGRRRLKRYIAQNCNVRAKEMADGLLNDLEEFRETTPVLDDQTALVLKVD